MSTAVAESNVETVIIDGLLGTKAERDKAFESAYVTYSDDLVRYVWRVYPLFDDHEIRTVVNDSFLVLAAKVGSGKFMREGGLKSFLLQTAKHKAVDALRRSGRIARRQTAVLEHLDMVLSNTQIGSVWKSLVDQEAADRCLTQFRILAGTLPPMQRAVAQGLADELERENFDPVSINDLVKKVSAKSGKLVTEAQIKSALREVRDKFRKILNRNKSKDL